MRYLATVLVLLLLAGPAAADAAGQAAKLNEEGIRLTKEGKFEEAIEAFTKARHLLPGDVTLRKNLAIARSKLGGRLLGEEKKDEALKQLRLAAALDPGNAIHHANLGIALARTGDPKEGRKSLEKAIAIDPKCASAHAELGSLDYEARELEKAIHHWEIALENDPGRKKLAEALEKAKKELAVEGGHTKQESAHFRVSWNGEKDLSVGSRVLRILEDAYEKISSDLGIRPGQKVLVVLYGEKEFKDVTGAQAWVGGLFDGRIRIPVKNFASAEQEIRDTIFHEYTHVAIHSVTKSCPAWLNEGLAQYFEGKSRVAADSRVRKSKKLPGLMSLEDLTPSFARFQEADRARLAYAQALSITCFLLEEHGPDRITRFLDRLGKGGSPGDASELAFHRSLRQIYLAWEGNF